MPSGQRIKIYGIGIELATCKAESGEIANGRRAAQALCLVCSQLRFYYNYDVFPMLVM
jgi:hypothetical protein